LMPLMLEVENETSVRPWKHAMVAFLTGLLDDVDVLLEVEVDVGPEVTLEDETLEVLSVVVPVDVADTLEVGVEDVRVLDWVEAPVERMVAVVEVDVEVVKGL